MLIEPLRGLTRSNCWLQHEEIVAPALLDRLWALAVQHEFRVVDETVRQSPHAIEGLPYFNTLPFSPNK